MKIVDIRNRFIDQYLFVEIYTDEGIKGVGESGAWAFLEASAEAVNTFKRYLIGADPLQIEHNWQVLYRCYHFRGAAIMGALSAVDIALWDIAGKYYGVPVYKLLGGKVRDKARVYYHVYGASRAELVQGCIKAKEQGFTAVGHLTPFINEPRTMIAPFETYAKKIEDGVESVRQYREAVGNDVDLCIEMHRQLSIPEAITFGREIEKYHPFFYEDPVKPDNIDDMARVAEKVGIPIATGERFHTLYEFAMLIARNGCSYVRPDVCMCGGITHAKKIASLSEAFGVQVVPHNPLSPVSTAACMQIAASCPNFAIQEYPIGEDVPPKSRIVKSTIKLDKGFLIVPDSPGIGIELSDDAELLYPYRKREYVTRIQEDGSVFDQ